MTIDEALEKQIVEEDYAADQRERRERIATAAMASLIEPHDAVRGAMSKDRGDRLVSLAVALADGLIAALDGKAP